MILESTNDYVDQDNEQQRQPPSNLILYLLVLAVIIELFLMNFILVKYLHKISDSTLLIVALVLLATTFLVTSYLLARRRPNKVNYSFKVPLLPWIPLLGLFFNTYLMLSLSALTWYRFLGWLAIGKRYFIVFLHSWKFATLLPHPLTTDYFLEFSENGRFVSRIFHSVILSFFINLPMLYILGGRPP